MSLSLGTDVDGAVCVVDPTTIKALALPVLDDNRSDVDNKKKQRMTTVGAANDFDSVVKRR